MRKLVRRARARTSRPPNTSAQPNQNKPLVLIRENDVYDRRAKALRSVPTDYRRIAVEMVSRKRGVSTVYDPVLKSEGFDEVWRFSFNPETLEYAWVEVYRDTAICAARQLTGVAERLSAGRSLRCHIQVLPMLEGGGARESAGRISPRVTPHSAAPASHASEK